MARPIDPEKRRAILQSARKIIVRDGYQAAKISTIAQEAGVAAGTVYLYFESKEAIANALATEFFDKAGALMRDFVPKFPERAAIEDYIDSLVQFAAAEKDLLSEVKPDPNMAEDEFSRQRRLELHGGMSNMLRQLMADGKIRKYDAGALTALIFGMLHSIVMGSIVFEDMPLKVYKETCADLLQRALRCEK